MTAASDVRVDPANREQLRAWDGDEGAYWAEHADYFDRSVVAYHQRLLDAASIADTERVLDVGCGSGQTTRDAARAAAGGEALGVDLVADARACPSARRRRRCDQRLLRAGRRPNPPVPARIVRHRHQPHRRHVLRRSHNSVQQHWPCIAPRGRLR